MKNLGLKFVSLLLACVVWFLVSAPRREPASERVFAASVSLVRVPRAVSSQSLEVPVDLSWLQQPGDVTITLRPQAINVPPEVEVVAIEPNKFKFRVEQLRQRAVPIRPFLVGEPPAGYITGEPALEPERALVSGPASQILNLSEVATERIIMTGRTATFRQSVAIVSDSPLVRIVTPLTTQITVPVLAEIGPNPPFASDTTATTTTTSPPKRKPE